LVAKGGSHELIWQSGEWWTILLPFKLDTFCVSVLVESLAVNALAIRDSPLCVIPLEVKSNIAREGRVGIADIKC